MNLSEAKIIVKYFFWFSGYQLYNHCENKFVIDVDDVCEMYLNNLM